MAKRIQCPCCGTVRVINKTSGFIGVDYHKNSNKWRTRVTNNTSRTLHLGYFDSELEASIVYDDFIINNKLINRPLNHPKRNIYINVCST